MLPQINEKERTKRLNIGSISNRWSERTLRSPPSYPTDPDPKSLSSKFTEILSKRKKRRLKSKKEIFAFLGKYNELIEEGIRKVCKGRFEGKKEDKGQEAQDARELRDFFSIYSKGTLGLVLEMLDKSSFGYREYLVKALDGVNGAMEMQRTNHQHYLAKVGGTGLQIDSSEDPLPAVDPPFLPPVNRNYYKYTLVLDLDETLVHYFQTEEEGK